MNHIQKTRPLQGGFFIPHLFHRPTVPIPLDRIDLFLYKESHF